MAIENNKNNSLAAELNDESTTDPETLAVESLFETGTSGNRAAPDASLDIQRIGGASDSSANAQTELKSEISARSESVSRLRFDIQQLRTRWSGLEKEIKAREALTTRLNRRLLDSQKRLACAETQQSDREAENLSLRANLKEKLSLLTSVEREARKISETVESGKSVIDELQEKIGEQQLTIRKLVEENQTFDDKKISALETLADKEQQIAKLRSTVSDGNNNSQLHDDEISTLRNGLGNALQEIENLRASLHSDRAPERRENHRRLADQDGLIVRNLQEINALKTQIVRTEGYADELRTRLQDREVESGEDEIRQKQLEGALSQARLKIGEMGELLKRTADVEQLTSDLIDSQGYRQALESQLQATDKESKRTIANLSRKLQRLEKANEDIERQLENKDNAIAALLSELASRSQTIDSVGEIQNVIHEIDGRMSDQISNKPAAEKDRMARLLIGNVAGQKLRFPLFKDRLTIGRTVQNDIQLKAHFVSRRHAVIVTEGGQSRIVDWGSKNGVYVNDTRVAEQTLKNGDIVAIGTAEFRYEERVKH